MTYIYDSGTLWIKMLLQSSPYQSDFKLVISLLSSDNLQVEQRNKDDFPSKLSHQQENSIS